MYFTWHKGYRIVEKPARLPHQFAAPLGMLYQLRRNNRELNHSWLCKKRAFLVVSWHENNLVAMGTHGASDHCERMSFAMVNGCAVRYDEIFHTRNRPY